MDSAFQIKQRVNNLEEKYSPVQHSLNSEELKSLPKKIENENTKLNEGSKVFSATVKSLGLTVVLYLAEIFGLKKKMIIRNLDKKINSK